MLEYKGYHGEIIYDSENEYYDGRLCGIRDLVTFGGATTEEVKKDFYAAVDDYLDYCKELNQEPNHETDTELNLLVDPKLCKLLQTEAEKSGKNFHDFVEKILADYMAKLG